MPIDVQLEKWGDSSLVSVAPRERDAEVWDKTDRPLRFRAKQRVARPASMLKRTSDSARVRWLVENDVHTEFLDGGIGCTWFAYRGDAEPVCGETEEEAVGRLAAEIGLEPWKMTR